jgi:3-methyl-2-oxobutanoate hydroxymethyltransferase
MAETKRKKVTIRQLHEMKARKEPIIAVGVYDAPMAAIADSLGFEMLIIGNAGPMSLFGHKSPMTTKFEEYLFMTQAVSRVSRYGLIVSHLPYLSYHASKEDAIRSAARMVSEGGAECVKCEGNRYTAEYVAEIVRAGIPAMGHIGMQASRKVEQSGYGVKGRKAEEAKNIVEDALAFVEAGVFAFIIEQTPVELTRYLKEKLPVPVISAGAGRTADGIYLISGDAVGYSAFPRPANEGSFVDVRPIIEEGLRLYRDHARAGKYPTEEQTPHMSPEEHGKFLQLVG